MKKKKLTGKILFIVLLIILLPILLVNLVIMFKAITNKDEVPGIFGIKPMIVMTNSMHPEIEAGDLILIKDVNTSTLKVGDIISFRESDRTVTTHRIIKINTTNDTKEFTTKGDNNNTPDKDSVKESNVEGIFIKRIPYLGSYINYIQTPAGIAIISLSTILICLVIALVSKNNNKEIDIEYEEYKRNKLENKK